MIKARLVSIPDLCTLTYFAEHLKKWNVNQTPDLNTDFRSFDYSSNIYLCKNSGLSILIYRGYIQMFGMNMPFISSNEG